MSHPDSTKDYNEKDPDFVIARAKFEIETALEDLDELMGIDETNKYLQSLIEGKK